MSSSFRLSSTERRVLGLAVACLLVSTIALGTGVGSTLSERDEEGASQSRHGAAGAPLAGDEPIDEGAAVTILRSAVLGEPDAGATPVSELRDGVSLPVIERRGEFYRVLTPCEIEGWIPADNVHAYPRSSDEAPSSLGEATILLDAGHGGRDAGAVGPGGFTEKEVNLEIISRLVPLLHDAEALRHIAPQVASDHEIAPPRVLLTRTGDYYAGLRFRAELANRLNAHAFVSIHNNASPDLGLSDRPGTEMYYQHASERSKRLAGLLYEEVYRAIEHHDIAWATNRDAGAKYRLNSEGGDYYALLRRPDVPSVLVEALFISNPPEEALLREERVQQALAEAHARAFLRYFETDDPGSGFVEPIQRASVPGGGMISNCVDPA